MSAEVTDGKELDAEPSPFGFRDVIGSQQQQLKWVDSGTTSAGCCSQALDTCHVIALALCVIVRHSPISSRPS